MLSKNRLIYLSVVCASLLHAEAVNAAADAKAMLLDLHSAVELAMQASPQVQRAQQARDQAAARRVGAGLLFQANPQVGVSSGVRRDGSGSQPAADGWERGLRLEQPLEVYGQRRLRLREVDSGLQRAEVELWVARQGARAAAKRAYMACVAAIESLRVARQQRDLSDDVRQAVTDRVQAGDASDIDLSLAQAAHGHALVEEHEAAHLAEQSHNSLRLLIQRDADQVLTLVTPLEAPSLPLTLTRSEGKRGELVELELAYEQTELVQRRLTREALPSPSLVLEAMEQQPGQRYLGVGLGFTMPLWNRKQGEMAVNGAERTRLSRERVLKTKSIAAEIRNARLTVEAQSHIEMLWRTAIKPAAQRQADLTFEGWRAGKLDLFRLLQSQRELREARLGEVAALLGLWQAVIAYENATSFYERES